MTVRKIYKYNDAVISAFSRDIIYYMRENLSKFAEYGVTEEELDIFEQKRNDFNKIIPAYFNKYTTTEVKISKDEVKKQLLEQIRNISLRFKLLWGENSMEYNGLGLRNINPQHEEKLLIIAKNLNKAVTDNFTALQTVGMTEEQAELFANTVISFDDKLQEYSQAKLKQKMHTENQVTKGNELYKLARKYSEIGKRVFADYYPMYRFFVLMKENTGTLAKPENVVYDSAENLLKWEHVTRAISYRVEYSADGINFEKLKATKKEFLPLGDIAEIKGYYRLKARNMQNYGPYSDVLEIK